MFNYLASANIIFREKFEEVEIWDKPDFLHFPDFKWCLENCQGNDKKAIDLYDNFYRLTSCCAAYYNEDLGLVPPLIDAVTLCSIQSIPVPEALAVALKEVFSNYGKEKRKGRGSQAVDNTKAYEKYCTLFSRWVMVWEKVFPRRAIENLKIEENAEGISQIRGFEDAYAAVIADGEQLLQEKGNAGALINKATGKIISEGTLKNDFDDFRKLYANKGWVFVPNLNPVFPGSEYYFQNTFIRNPWVILAFYEILASYNKGEIPRNDISAFSFEQAKILPNLKGSVILNRNPESLREACKLACEYMKKTSD